MKLSRLDVFALIFLMMWRVLFYLPVTLGQRVFSAGDILWLFLPIRTELARALAEGRLPLWTPALQAGFPLFAEGEVAALYPINLIFHRLLPAHFALSYTILFNLAWAAIGMYWFCRTFGLRSTSALLAGFVFGAGGFMTAHIMHAPHVAVASWLPWLLAIQQKYFQAWREHKRSILWFLAMAAAVMLQLLGGFPQFALFNIATLGLFALVTPVCLYPIHNQPNVSYRVILESLLGAILATMLGIGLAAVQLLPTVELIGLSIRGQDMPRAFFTSYSLDLAALTQFFSPFAYLGMPQAGNMEYFAYFGMLPLLLLLLTLLLRRDARTWFFAMFGAVALLLALGGNTPFYDWLYNVPLFNRFRVPARFLLLFTFAAAFLAAMGLEELQNRVRGSVRHDSWQIAALVIGFAFLAGGIIYLAYEQPIEFWLEIWQRLPIVLFIASIALIVATRWRWMTRAALAALVIGLTVCDVAAFSAVFLTHLNRTSTPTEILQVPRTVQAMDNRQTLYRIFETKTPMTPAAVRAVLFTNMPILYNKQGVSGYLHSLAIRRNQKYLDEMSLGMRSLIGMRYYLLPLEMPPFGESLPPWWDEFEPDGGLTPDALGAHHPIPPTRVSQIEITSYTDQTLDLPNGHLVGEITLTVETGQTVTLPIRLGIETADWAYDTTARVAHHKPQTAESFPAYLKSIGRAFEGHKYIVRYPVAPNSAPIVVTSVGAHSLLPVGRLNIERVLLIDETGQSRSLAKLWCRNDLALVFRSHTAAMWENHDALPRAFVAHRAEIVSDDQALERLKTPCFPYDELVLLSDVPSTALIEEVKSGSDYADVVEYKPERVVVNVKTESAGYLVVTDSWYPGWRAWVDGRETPIYRADYIFRAVPLSPGQHTVVFEYHPASLLWGAVISGVSVLLCVALVIFRWQVGRSH